MRTAVAVPGGVVLSVAGLFLAAPWIGCGGDDEIVTTPDSADETFSFAEAELPEAAPDTMSTESVTDGDSAEAAAPPDRKLTFLFGSPDSAPMFVCLAAFLPNPDGTPNYAALAATHGPFGKSDPKDPTDVTKYAPFSYGDVLPYLVDSQVASLLDGLPIAAYFLTTNPGEDGCKAHWNDVKGDVTKVVPIKKGTVSKNENWLIARVGCQATNVAGCGSGIEFMVAKLSTDAPATYVPADAPLKVGIQFVHGSPVVGFQDRDIYIQPMRGASSGEDAGEDGDVLADGGTMPTPAGTPVLIAGGGSVGTKFKFLQDAVTGVGIEGDPAEALLLVVLHGAPPCLGPTCEGKTTAIPLKPFLAQYGTPEISGGFIGNQIFALTGGPDPEDPSKSTVRVIMTSLALNRGTLF